MTAVSTIEFLGMEINSRSLELRVPGRKLKKNQTGGNQGTQPGASWETVFGVPGYSTRSPVLQSDSEGSGISVRKGQSILQRALSTVAGSKGRTLLVGRSANQMEREKPSSKEPRPTDRVRCLPYRLGSVLRGGTYRRSMSCDDKFGPP